ncbi:MAG: DUF3108 domain-containing protein [Pseudomonadota bacterium]
MSPLRQSLGLVIGLALWASSAEADPNRGVFDIYLGNLKVGVFAFSGVEAQGRYSTAGLLRSTGVVGFFANVRYDAKSQGRVRGARYVPSSYEERAEIGAQSSELSIIYDNGVPRAPVFNPPRPGENDVDLGRQGDALDLMTALYTLLRGVPEPEVCGYDAFVFDGVRRTRLSLAPREADGRRVICDAEYRRVEGFTAEELSERPTFGFDLVFAPIADGLWAVDEANVDTVYGPIRLERRPPDG